MAVNYQAVPLQIIHDLLRVPAAAMKQARARLDLFSRASLFLQLTRKTTGRFTLFSRAKRPVRRIVASSRRCEPSKGMFTKYFGELSGWWGRGGARPQYTSTVIHRNAKLFVRTRKRLV